MNLKQIEIFCAVMRCRTTIAAAYELGLSQPGVSNAVKHLETAIGFKLFDRIGNRLIPTHEAASLYRDAQPLQMMARSINERIVALKDTQQGHLRVISTNPLGDTIVPQAVAELMSSRPNIQVYFDVQGMDGVIEAVETGFADLGIAIAPDLRPALGLKPIIEGRMACVMQANHPLAAKASLGPAELAQHSVIGLEPTTRLGGLVATAFRDAGVHYSPNLVVHKGVTACRLAMQGAGIAITDEFSAGMAAAENMVVRAFHPLIAISGSIVSLKERPLSRLAKRFVGILTNIAQKRSPAIGAGTIPKLPNQRDPA